MYNLTQNTDIVEVYSPLPAPPEVHTLTLNNKTGGNAFTDLLAQVTTKLDDIAISKYKAENQQKSALVLSQLANDQYFPEILQEIEDNKAEVKKLQEQKDVLYKKMTKAQEEFDNTDADVRCWLYDGTKEPEEIVVFERHLDSLKKSIEREHRKYIALETAQVNRLKVVNEKYKLLGIDNMKSTGVVVITDNSVNKNPYAGFSPNQAAITDQPNKSDDFIDAFINPEVENRM